MTENFLFLPILIPIIGGMVLFGLKNAKQRFFEIFIEALLCLNLVLVLLLALNPPENGFAIFQLTGNLEFALKLDGLGSVFAVLVAVLWPLATLYAFEYMDKEERKTGFFAFYTMTYGVTLGIAFAGNLVTLYLFYEMLTLVTVPLVMFGLSEESCHASRKYLYYSLGGAAFAFIGLIFVLTYGNTLDFIPGGVLDSVKMQGKENLLLLIYVMAFCGFGVKAALVPFHGWLPSAAVAPTPVTALLHAVAVVKAGAFAILRLTYYSYGAEFLHGTWAQDFVMLLCMLTIVYGSTRAFREIHFKRRLAYSTISNLSYILLAASMMSRLGLYAALSHMVIHAVMKICSFFCAGAVMHQSGKNYIYELDGIAGKMPVTFLCFTAASLSLTGIPLFAGFISKWNIAQAAVAEGSVLSFASICVLLYSAFMTGVYMLTIVIRAVFPKKSTDFSSLEGVRDAGWKMTLPLLLFCIAILLIGVYPAPLMQILENVAKGIL